MFIIFFAIFIFIFTVRENIWIGGIVFVVMVISLGIFYYCKKLPNKEIFLIVTLAFLLGLGSFLRNTYSNPSNINQSKSFMGTGIIQDTSTAGKYIFTTSTASYLLQSKQEHKIGEELFLVGRRSSGAYFGSTNPPRSLQSSSPLNKGDVQSVSEKEDTDQSFLAFDYPKWLKMKGLQGLIYESNSSVIQNNQAGRISQIKKSLQQKVISFYGKNKISGLILGMLIGDRSLIPTEEYKGFINSGLVHLIAVSGGNLVMITVFLGLILFFLPFYLRSGVILLAIIFYALLCGLDSSVFRAVITGGLSLLALFRGKEIPIWRLLSIAFIAMLIINPYYLVYDVGFLMSFGAVIGIILFSQRKISSKAAVESGELKPMVVESGDITKNKSRYSLLITRYSKYIRKNYLQPSIGATMGVFPIIIFFMGQLNLLSIIGNLFVLPIIPFVMIYGFVSIFFFQLLHRQRILLIEKFLILYIYKVSEFSSSFGLYLSMSGWIKWVLLIGFLAWFIWKRMNKKKEKDPAKDGAGLDAGNHLSSGNYRRISPYQGNFTTSLTGEVSAKADGGVVKKIKNNKR